MEITPDRLHNKIALKFLKEKLSIFGDKEIKLLDVGSADNIIKEFLPKNVKYYSLELPEEEQDEELREYKHEFILDLDREHIPVESGFFDIIVCLDVIEHTLYPERVLEELKRVTKKDGIFVISIPNEYNFVHRFYYLFAIKTRGETPWKVVEMHQHIQKPRVRDTINLLSNNFKKMKVEYIWASRSSYKNKFFRIIDKIINMMAKVNPSLFAINVVAICEEKKNIKNDENGNFSAQNRKKYY